MDKSDKVTEAESRLEHVETQARIRLNNLAYDLRQLADACHDVVKTTGHLDVREIRRVQSRIISVSTPQATALTEAIEDLITATAELALQRHIAGK